MKTVLKIAGILVGLFIVIVIAAALILPRVVDPNDYKDRIVSLVEKKTGRNLKILGDVGLSVFPWLGVRIGAVEMGNAAGFQAPLFARLERLQIRIRLIPLLAKRVEADVVTVEGLAVNLERNTNGQTNWADLVKSRPEKEAPAQEGEVAVAGALLLGGVDIREASMTWTDRLSGQHLSVSDLSVKTSAITLVDPVDLKIGFEMDAGPTGPKGRVDTGARVYLDLNQNTHRLDDFKLTAELTGDKLPGRKITIQAEGAATFDGRAERLQIAGLKLEANGLALPPYAGSAVLEVDATGNPTSTAFEVTGLRVALSMTEGQDRLRADLSAVAQADLKTGKATVSRLTLNVPEFTNKQTRMALSSHQPATATLDLAAMAFSLNGFRLNGTVADEILGTEPAPVSISLPVRGNWSRQTASVDPFQLDAFGVKTTGRISVAQMATAPQVSAALTVDPFNPREVLGRLVQKLPHMADSKALTMAQCSATITGSTEGLSIETLKARLDDTRLEGKVGISWKPSAAYVFDLRVDGIDADRYLPPPAKGAQPAAATPGAAAAALPLEPLRALNLDGKISVGKLKIANVRMENIQLEARAKDGRLRVEPISAALYGGTYRGDISVDARGAEPSLRVDEKLSGVRIGGLLKDLQGKAPIWGIANAEMQLTATGSHPDAITRSLNGQVDFRFADGAIEGVDIFGRICRTLSALRSGSLKGENLVSGLLQMMAGQDDGNESPSVGRTEFSELAGTIAFKDGMGSNKDLLLKSPLLRLEGAGTFDLINQRLQYDATAALVKSCEGQGGKGLKELANLQIPLSITGALQNLEIKPNITAAMVQFLSQPESRRKEPEAAETPTPPATAQEQGQPAAEEQQQPKAVVEEPKDSKKEVEGAVRDLLQKGLQDLFKKP